jgi:hypothetical protein
MNKRKFLIGVATWLPVTAAGGGVAALAAGARAERSIGGDTITFTIPSLKSTWLSSPHSSIMLPVYNALAAQGYTDLPDEWLATWEDFGILQSSNMIEADTRPPLLLGRPIRIVKP